MANTDAAQTSIANSFGPNAQNYERRTGGCTRHVARYIIDVVLSGILDKAASASPPLKVHDNACGTAQVTSELLRRCPSAQIDATDAAPGMVDIVRGLVGADAALRERVAPAVMDAAALAFPDAAFDVSVTNFGIFFLPDPLAGVREVYRTLRPGGTAVLSSWKVIGMVPVFYEAQRLVAPANPVPEMALFEEWSHREKHEATFKEAGFRESSVVEVPTAMSGAKEEDLLFSLSENYRAMARNNWSEEELSRLDEAVLQVMRNPEKKSLFVRTEDGSMGVSMVAWVGVGIK